MQNSVLVAGVLFLLIATFRNVRPSVWDKIPTSVRWLVPIALGVAQEVAAALYTGQPWRQVALEGALSGLMAMGMHTGVKALPGPYKG